MKFGVPISVTLHTAIVFGGLVMWGSAPSYPKVEIIPMSLVSVGDVTDVAPTRAKPPKTPEQTQRAPAGVAPNDLPNKPAVLASAEPAPKDAAPDTVVPQQSAPPPPKPDKQPAFDLDFISDQLNQPGADTPYVPTGLQNERPQGDVTGQDRIGVGAGQGNQIDGEDYIRQKMQSCWQIDEGMQGYERLKVSLRVNLDRDGNIVSVDVLNSSQIIASGNPSWQAAREKAISGVYECEESFRSLPKDAYMDWQSTELTFDPGANR